MAEQKRYFWLKLHDDFFGSLRIKKLRKMAGGDTFVIIYLKMQLKAMKTDGIIPFRGVEHDIVEELALDLDEEPDNVRITLAYLLSCGLAESNQNLDLFLPFAVKCVGTEAASTQRWRDWKERKALESNTTPTLPQQNANVEKEKDKEKDKDIEKDNKGGKPPSAHKHGVYGWVRLTDAQYEKLVADLGQAELTRCITYIDEAAQKTHNKNHWTDWNLVIRHCHRDGWGLGRGNKVKPHADDAPIDLSALQKAVSKI